MAIKYSTKIQDDVLVVTSKGFDENLEEVKQFNMKLLEKAMTSGCSKVISDERQLEYRISTIDTHELAEFVSQNVPFIARVAIVPDPQFMADAKFYEDTIVNRGLRVKIFEKIEDAFEWMKEA